MEPISINQLKEGDLLWLAKALLKDPYRTTAEEILLGASRGRFQLWRLSNGVAVTGVLQDGNGRNLFIYCAAGRGIVKELKEELQKVARAFGCKRIGGMATGTRVRLFLKLGCKEIAREMYYEVPSEVPLEVN